EVLNDTDSSGAPGNIPTSDVGGLAVCSPRRLSPDPFIRYSPGNLDSSGSVGGQAGSGDAVHAPSLCDRSVVHLSQVSGNRRVSGENDEGNRTSAGSGPRRPGRRSESIRLLDYAVGLGCQAGTAGAGGSERTRRVPCV